MEAFLLGPKPKIILECSHSVQLSKTKIAGHIGFEDLSTNTMSMECYVCERSVQPLWICLTNDCMKSFCTATRPNHALCHFTVNPDHCIQVNSFTKEMWCFTCKSQILHVKKGESIPGSTGLVNLGNSCYVNAILQALSNTPQIRSYFLKNAQLGNANNCEFGLSAALEELILHLWSKKSKNSLVQEKILRQISNQYPIFKNNDPEDCHEFLRCLLELLHNELKPCSSADEINYDVCSTSRDKTIVSEVFKGELLNIVKCVECRQRFETVEPFLILSLPIPYTKNVGQYLVENTASDTQYWLYNENQSFFQRLKYWINWVLYKPRLTLHDCLAAFFTLEKLKNQTQLSCSECGKMTNGLKTFKIRTLPEVLCIQLKRIMCDDDGHFKINGVIQFPFEGLDLRYYMEIPFPNENSRYTLMSIISHQGDKPNNGRFTCYSLNCLTNKWLHFDDKHVTQISRDELNEVEAYILFYRKECVTKQRIINRLKLLISLSQHEPKNCFISREWLTKFHSFSEPGEINNNGIKCEHGKLLNRRKYIRVTYPVWTHLIKYFNGGPQLRDEDFCLICSEEMLVRKEFS